MHSRLELQSELTNLLGSDHVYFQPPESIRLQYPCFIYERSSGYAQDADDLKYNKYFRYELMYITKEPDTNDFVNRILDTFMYCTYTRHFVSENLNHEVFDLYY